MEEPGAVVLETEPGDAIIFTESLRHGGMPVSSKAAVRNTRVHLLGTGVMCVIIASERHIATATHCIEPCMITTSNFDYYRYHSFHIANLH